MKTQLPNGKWRVRTTIDGRRVHLGVFDNEADADRVSADPRAHLREKSKRARAREQLASESIAIDRNRENFASSNRPPWLATKMAARPRLKAGAPRAETDHPWAIVYFIRCTVTGLVKIGITGDSAEKRLRALQVGSPTLLELLGHALGGSAEERELHKAHAGRWSHGEWFRFTLEEAKAELERLQRRNGTRDGALAAAAAQTTGGQAMPGIDPGSREP